MTATRGPSICRGDTVLLADVGNTRIKLAVVADLDHGAGRPLPRITRRQDLMSRDFRPANLEAWLAGVAPGPAVLLVGSVHEAAAVRLEAAVAEVSATRHRAVRQRRIGHTDLPLQVLVAEPHRVGIDRLAGAAAAALLKDAARPAIVVDCGTATTVNLVDDDGSFRGGPIAPGLRAFELGLRQATPALPPPRLDVDPPAWPRSTQDAVDAGVLHGYCGLVERLVAGAIAAARGGASVFVTGGNALRVLRHSRLRARSAPDLVHRGLRLLADETKCVR